MYLVWFSVLLLVLTLLLKGLNEGKVFDYLIMVSVGIFFIVSAVYDKSKGESFGRFIEVKRHKNPEMFGFIVIIRYLVGAFGIAFGLFKLLQHMTA